MQQFEYDPAGREPPPAGQPGEALLYEDCTTPFTGKSISPTGKAPILEMLFPYPY